MAWGRGFRQHSCPPGGRGGIDPCLGIGPGIGLPLRVKKALKYAKIHRLLVVSTFGDGDCGAGEIYTRARKIEETRREGSAEN